MNGASDLLPEFRGVLVPVNGNGMLHRRFEKFAFRVRHDGNRAIHLARHFAAVNELPSHGILLCGRSNDELTIHPEHAYGVQKKGRPKPPLSSKAY